MVLFSFMKICRRNKNTSKSENQKSEEHALLGSVEDAVKQGRETLDIV